MNVRLISTAILAAVLVTTATAQTVYRWVDANGRVQYSDQPPPPGAKDAQERNVQGNSIQNNEASLGTVEAQKKNPVTLYVSECGESCDSAKSFLNKRGVPHTVVDPTRSAELNKKFKDETGSNVLPVLKIGERRLTGWSEGNWTSALDSAGYPKTAAFGKTKAVEDRTGIDPPKKPAAADGEKADAAEKADKPAASPKAPPVKS
jgi:glutaredoxin